MLISDALIEQLNLKTYNPKNLGHIELRGRSERVKLYAIEELN